MWNFYTYKQYLLSQYSIGSGKLYVIKIESLYHVFANTLVRKLKNNIILLAWNPNKLFNDNFHLIHFNFTFTLSAFSTDCEEMIFFGQSRN